MLASGSDLRNPGSAPHPLPPRGDSGCAPRDLPTVPHSTRACIAMAAALSLAAWPPGSAAATGHRGSTAAGVPSQRAALALAPAATPADSLTEAARAAGAITAPPPGDAAPSASEVERVL